MSHPERSTPRRALAATAKRAKDLDPITYGLGTAILVALFLVFLVNGREAQGDESLTTTSARRGVVELTSSGSGSIEPARNTDLAFETSGKVVEVYVEAGDKVKKGDPIARLDRRSAELAVEEAEANLEDAENGTSSTTGVSYTGQEGEVQTGFAVYTGGSVPSTLTAISESGASQVASATGTTGTTDQVDESVTGPTGTTGATGSTGPTGPSAPSNTSPDHSGNDSDGGADADLPSSSGSMSGGSMGGGGSTSGGSTGSETSETAIAKAELELEEAKSALAATVLRAPYTGTIVSISGAVGDSVSGEGTTSASTSSASADSGSSSAPSDTGSGSTGSVESAAFAVLQQLDALEMEVSVSEADINQIHVGQRATVTISSADDEQLAATVSNVGLLASSDTSGVVTYPVTVRIDQRSDLVKPGMSATVSIVIDQVSGAITVPNQALSGNSVQVVDGESTETQTVETGLVGDSTTEIIEGLEEGQEIAIPQASGSDTGMPAGTGDMSELPGGLGGASGGFPGGGSGMPSPPSGGFPG